MSIQGVAARHDRAEACAEVAEVDEGLTVR
jgi:hypothetical protein